MMVLVAQTDWWTVSAAWAAALAALVYTGFTIWLVVETSRLRRAQIDPLVSVYLRISSRDAHWPELVVENLGNSAAFDLSFEFSRASFDVVGGPKLVDILGRTFRVLPAKARLVFEPHALADYPPTGCRGSMTVVARYARHPGATKKLSSPSELTMDHLSSAGLEVNADPLRLVAQRIDRLVSFLDQRNWPGSALRVELVDTNAENEAAIGAFELRQQTKAASAGVAVESKQMPSVQQGAHPLLRNDALRSAPVSQPGQ